MTKIWDRIYKTLHLGIFVAVMSLGFSSPSFAQGEATPERTLAKAKLFYDSGRYQDAFNELVALVGQKQGLKPAILVEVYTYLGFCYSAYDRRDLAKKQFKNALSYDPSLMLDPVFTSPKIMEVFEEAQKEFSREAGEQAKLKQAEKEKKLAAEPEAASGGEKAVEKKAPRAVKPAPRAEFKRVSTGGAVVRSLLVPGLGQFYTGHKVKGAIFMGGVAASAVMAISSHSRRISAEENYYQAHKASPENREKIWEDAEKFNRMENVFYAVTGAVWAANVIDAIFSARSPRGKRALITPYYALKEPGSPAVGLTANWRF